MSALQVMGLHPQYMKIFNKSQSFIMRGDGPLPYPYRHYIAIMVSPPICIRFDITCLKGTTIGGMFLGFSVNFH